MPPVIRHLLPGLVLIAAAASVLLLSDLPSARPKKPATATPTYTREHPAKLAILQFSRNEIMDDAHKGFMDALAGRGYREGDRLVSQTFIPEGDLPVAGQMAQRIVSDSTYNLGATITTVCLQAMANADKAGRLPFVFCAVTDPVMANVGIKSLDSLDKPAYLTGYGTAQPVADIFREAVKANPALKTVGVVWNPAEVNSQICTERARAVCKELGLTLLEAPISSSTDVRESADSLVSRGVQAFWTGGDATMTNAYDVLQQVADKAKIPIFSNISSHAKRGALFDLGANYYQVGFEAGLLAADILDGKSPATMPVRNLMPGRVGLNEKTRAAISDPWTFTKEQLDLAGYIVDASGKVRDIVPQPGTPTKSTLAASANSTLSLGSGPAALPASGKLPWRTQVVLYIETAPSEETLHGIMDGLKLSGLVEGKDYMMLRQRSAQGEIPTLGSMFDAAASEHADIYITLSTPTLQNAVRKVKDAPVVFTFVTDPMAAGAAESYEKHAANMTGVSTRSPVEAMANLIKTNFPAWKRIGTIYCPAEINSVININNFTAALSKNGIELVPVAANTAGDLPDASLALAGKNLDAIVQIADNLSAVGFSTIARAARSRHLPIFAFQSTMIDQGAMVALSMDYHQAGLDTAAKVVRVMRGESPATIPISLPSKQVLYISKPNARDQGVELPPALLQAADKVVE